MTFLEYRNTVTRFCKFSTLDTELTSLINDAINIALYDVSRMEKWPELLVIGLTIACNATYPYKLPLTFSEIDRVRFTPSGGTTWALQPRRGLVPPAPVFGKPRAYEIVKWPTDTTAIYALAIDPVDSVAADALTVNYYTTPTALAADADVPVSTNWDNEIIKRATNYVLIYRNSVPQAQELWKTMLSQMRSTTSTPSA